MEMEMVEEALDDHLKNKGNFHQPRRDKEIKGNVLEKLEQEETGVGRVETQEEQKGKDGQERKGKNPIAFSFGPMTRPKFKALNQTVGVLMHQRSKELVHKEEESPRRVLFAANKQGYTCGCESSTQLRGTSITTA
ncbi:hypothetical protein Bca101_067711 [Brassica carinata]